MPFATQNGTIVATILAQGESAGGVGSVSRVALRCITRCITFLLDFLYALCGIFLWQRIRVCSFRHKLLKRKI